MFTIVGTPSSSGLSSGAVAAIVIVFILVAVALIAAIIIVILVLKCKGTYVMIIRIQGQFYGSVEIFNNADREPDKKSPRHVHFTGDPDESVRVEIIGESKDLEAGQSK